MPTLQEIRELLPHLLDAGTAAEIVLLGAALGSAMILIAVFCG